MLGSAKVTAFISTTDGVRARKFYEGVLGLGFIRDDEFALVIDCNGVPLRVTKVAEFQPQPFTVLGWQVPDVTKTVTALGEKGVTFERYDWMQQDHLGIWNAPSKARVAWFKDPDGNLLSVTQHP